MGSPLTYSPSVQPSFDFDATLKGRILASSGEGIPFVSIGIVLPATGELLGGGTSDEHGSFSLKISSPEALTLRISAVGYEELLFPLEPLASGESKEIGELVLRESVGDLEEVTVRAARPDVRIEADKTVMRVAGTVLAEGNHALDVLGRAPGVFIDQEGRIQLNGRSGVVVFINDRQTYMSAEDLATFLRSMPADNIENIEVIANPGARYDAEGAGGVINIQLKKNTLDGIFGNVQLGSLYNGRYSPTMGLALNAKKGAWTTQFNVNYNEFAFDNDLEIFRNFSQENGVATFDQQSRITQRNRNLFTNATIDYALNDRHTVGMNVQLSGTRSTENTPSFTQIDTPGALQPDFFESFNRGDVQIGRVFANFNYVGKLDTIGTRLSADLDITRMDRGREALLTNFFWTGSQREEASMSRILNEEAMDYRILTAKVDLYRPLAKGSFEAGLKGSWVYSDNDLQMFRSEGENPFVVDPNTNTFLYEERVLAAYATLNGKLSPKFSYTGGLRLEHSGISGTSRTLNEVNTQRYTDLFPSLLLQHKVSDTYQIVYSANRRISRPNYGLLNPFVFFIDPLTTQTGNPQLRPQYANTLEMNHIVQGAYQFSISYAQTQDIFQQVFEQDEVAKTTNTFTTNLDRSHNVNVRAMLPASIASWWSTSNMLQGTYVAWKSPLGDGFLDVAQFSYMARTQHNLMLPKGYKVELVGMYMGPMLWGQALIKSMAWMDMGVSKTMLQDRLSVSLNFNDVFRSRWVRADVQFDQIDTRFRQYNADQSVRLTLRYKFSKGESFRLNQRSGSEEERSRLN